MLPKGACFVSSYVHMTVKKVFMKHHTQASRVIHKNNSPEYVVHYHHFYRGASSQTFWTQNVN